MSKPKRTKFRGGDGTRGDDTSTGRPSPAWARYGGPLLTAGLAVLIELLAPTPLHLSNPPALLMLAIVLSAFGGGLGPALVSAAVSWVYTAYFFSLSGEPFRFDEENLRRVALWGVTMPLTAFLVGHLNRRAARALAEADVAALRQARLEDRARAAEALREREELYRLLAENSNDLIYLLDLEGRIVYASPSVSRQLGRVPREKFEVIHAEDLAASQASWERVLAGKSDLWTGRVADADGRWHWLEASNTLIDYQGRPGVLSVCRDLTERRRITDDLRASEARFRTFVDHATDAFFLHDAEGNILDVNRQACEGLGYPREQLIGKSPFDFDVAIAKTELEQLHRRLDAGEAVAFETRHRRADGAVFPVEVRIRPFWEGERRFAVSLAQDITERKRTQEALVESQERLRLAVQASNLGPWDWDLRADAVEFSAEWKRQLGYEPHEVTGGYEEWESRLHSDDRERVMDLLEAYLDGRQPEYAVEFRLRHKDGSYRWIYTRGAVQRDAAGQPLRMMGCHLDVTERKRLEEQFRQAQKMEAVGRLAGGLAHDFNNLLTVITGYSEMVFSSLRADDPSRALLAEVQKAGERAAALTRQLLAFSRKQVLQPQVVNLNTLLEDLLRLLNRLIGEHIELAFMPGADLGLAKVDPAQFEQAVINLTVNARDAMPEGGRLTIETRNAELDGGDAERDPELQPGPYVLVAVSDTGHGMDPATKARIFEPFFTTKESGKGTGLGLAMVYGFVKQSEGLVEAYSESGLGTTLKIYLPRTQDVGPSARSSPILQMSPRGSETVLLVEDEDALRTLARIVLQSRGYAVLEARDGQEAVWVAQQHRGPIHLLLTDVVMPRMSGRQLAELLAGDRPNLRILFMSGYTDEAVFRQGELDSGVTLLQKPFSSIDLARKVREILDGREP